MYELELKEMRRRDKVERAMQREEHVSRAVAKPYIANRDV